MDFALALVGSFAIFCATFLGKKLQKFIKERTHLIKDF